MKKNIKKIIEASEETIDKDFDSILSIDPKFGDHIIEEGANGSTNLRMISWSGKPYKLDIRKYYYQDGKERCSKKGFTLSDEGGNTLAEVLVDKNYGDTRKLLKSIKSRDDYKDAIRNPDGNLEDDSKDDSNYYDPSMLLEGDHIGSSDRSSEEVKKDS